MPDSRPAAASWLKAALLALLAWNTATYLYAGKPGEGLDSMAWFVLLVSYELETAPGRQWGQGPAGCVLRGSRVGAVAALGLAISSYARESEWLDVVNVGLWIAVVALLEIEIRHPGAVKRLPRVFTGTAIALYGGLAALIAVWLLRGEWFDAYDAALWLFAFATLEMDVLGFVRTGRSAT